MAWTVTSHNQRVEDDILALPAGLVARFLQYAERMEAHGPDLGMPHTRAMGGGLFQLRIKATEGDRAGLLLHGRGSTDRRAAPIRDEDGQDACS